MNNMKKIYIIEYEAYSISNELIKSGKIRAKNKSSEIEAKCEFEKYLKNKYNNFGKLIIKSCKEEPIFNNIFNSFNDIFGRNNGYSSMFK